MFFYSGLVKITIPKSVVSLGKSVFTFCLNLEEVEFENGIKLEESERGDQFANCNNLTTVKLANTMNFLYDNMFSFCMNLVSIHIPSNITKLGESCFSDCTALATVFFHCKQLNTIGMSAFEDCDALINIGCTEAVEEKIKEILTEQQINDITFSRPALAAGGFINHNQINNKKKHNRKNKTNKKQKLNRKNTSSKKSKSNRKNKKGNKMFSKNKRRKMTKKKRNNNK